MPTTSVQSIRRFRSVAVVRSLPRKREILALAQRIASREGEVEIRIAPAFIDESTRARMAEAFARGDFATWPYDAKRAERAADPNAILDGAKSLLCFAFPYATPAPSQRTLRGRVSNYAWSADYHARVLRTLHEVAADLDHLAGEPVTAVACDTKPIAERAFAAHAGLGWVGKHTNLISPHLGSFVFLGEIVTTLELEPDAPLRKSCGSCARCIDACPTQALRGDYTMDATRCISDLTQRTDGIPREMRPLVGEWVWGCDICQNACPPTQQAGYRGTGSDAPQSDDRAAPDLFALLRIKSGEFRRSVQRTGMGWRGAAVLRRNAAVALGNALDRSAVPALCEALAYDPHPMVRSHAAWALGRIGSPRAIAVLRERLALEGDAVVLEEIAYALCHPEQSKDRANTCWRL
jgi:epoxyqueuosine reductase